MPSVSSSLLGERSLPMLRRVLASVARPLSRLGRFLRHAWLDRVPLTPNGQQRDWARLLGLTSRPTASGKRPPRPTVKLACEDLERREVPQDWLGLLQGGVGLGSFALVGGPLATPLSVVAQGWGAGQAGLGALPDG